MDYNRLTARRMLAGHLGNLYAAAVTLAAFQRDVHQLAGFAGEHEDLELESMARELVEQVSDPVTPMPTLVLPELGITVAPGPMTADELEAATEAARAAVEPEGDEGGQEGAQDSPEGSGEGGGGSDGGTDGGEPPEGSGEGAGEGSEEPPASDPAPPAGT